MDFLNKSLTDYIEAHSEPENEMLAFIARDTHAHVLMPRMLSGHFQGRVLSMFCAMIQPSSLLEIGTFTGYSALCMAENLKEGGKIITLDINEELENRVRGYFKKFNKEQLIDYRIGNAIEIIPTLKETFDLVFIDADKINYSHYFDLVIDKVRAGGFIIADNVLWSGKVADPKPTKKDKDLEAILEFNAKIQNDPRVTNVLFPIRDGLMVMKKN